MLSRPFRGLARGRLVFLLVLFLLLEGALGAGFYVNNRTTAASTTPPAALGSVYLLNSSHHVGFGNHSLFSAMVAAHKGAYVAYTMRLPNGKHLSGQVLTDRTGYSKFRFLVTYAPRAGVANTVTVTVSYHGVPQASSTFHVVGVTP